MPGWLMSTPLPSRMFRMFRNTHVLYCHDNTTTHQSQGKVALDNLCALQVLGLLQTSTIGSDEYVHVEQITVHPVTHTLMRVVRKK